MATIQKPYICPHFVFEDNTQPIECINCIHCTTTINEEDQIYCSYKTQFIDKNAATY